ncbi:protein PFC0760c [Ricinus communis]|uniref:protein PFC0760c n=1 Tax=Ricinus communis TaxID=3988 RepID=UPI00201A8481|nr:protein PFC0760c [Ricinus communis]
MASGDDSNTEIVCLIRISDDGIEEEKEEAENRKNMKEEAGQEGDQGVAASNDDKTDILNLTATFYNQMKIYASDIKEGEKEEAENEENKEEEARKDESDQITAKVVEEEKDEDENHKNVVEAVKEGNRGVAAATDDKIDVPYLTARCHKRRRIYANLPEAENEGGQDGNEWGGDQGAAAYDRRSPDSESVDSGTPDDDDDDYYYYDDDVGSDRESHKIAIWVNEDDIDDIHNDNISCVDTIEKNDNWASADDLESEVRSIVVEEMKDSSPLITEINMRLSYSSGHELGCKLLDPEAMEWAEFLAAVATAKVFIIRDGLIEFC